MSETAPEATQDGNEGGQTSTAPDFKPINTPAELDAFLKDRVARAERKAAEKFADYDDLKSKAAQFDALSEASKTAEEKLTERITNLENEIEASRLAASRERIAREFDLNDEQAAALKYAPSEEAAREIAQGYAADASNRKKNGNRVPTEGTSTRPADNAEAAFAHSLFGGGD